MDQNDKINSDESPIIKNDVIAKEFEDEIVECLKTPNYQDRDFCINSTIKEYHIVSTMIHNEEKTSFEHHNKLDYMEIVMYITVFIFAYIIYCLLFNNKND